MIVCSCLAVTDTTIRQFVRSGCTSLDAIVAACGAGSDCGMCIVDLRRLLPPATRPVLVDQGEKGARHGSAAASR